VKGLEAFQRILLTGGSGFVGGHLAPRVAAAAPQARKVMLNRPGERRVRDGWDTVNADIADQAAVARIVEAVTPDLVIHLAGQASVGASRESAAETWRTNFGGAFAMGCACAGFAPEATVFFVSTAEVYGVSFNDGVAAEDAPLRPQNVYARSKAAAEMALGDVLAASNRLITARAFNHTGPGQDERFVLPSFAAQIARIEAGVQPPTMRVGNLDAARDFLDVRDVVEAYLALIGTAASGPQRAVYNVASGTARRVRDVLELMRGQARASFEVEVDSDRLRPSEIPSAAGRNERIVHATGWTPRFPIEETLQSLLEDARRRVAA
jgi:GDP-4-dehydro-6-deoxy-D-mannose reductase